MMARHVILFSQQQQQKVVFILRPSKQLGGNLIHFFFFPFPPTHCSLLQVIHRIVSCLPAAAAGIVSLLPNDRQRLWKLKRPDTVGTADHRVIILMVEPTIAPGAMDNCAPTLDEDEEPISLRTTKRQLSNENDNFLLPLLLLLVLRAR